MHYYEVALTLIVRKNSSTLTYAHKSPLTIGTIVSIEIGSKLSTGIIYREVDKPDYNTKPILNIIEPQPIPISLVETAAWMSEYYGTNLSNAIQLLIPRGVQKNRRPARKRIHGGNIRNRTKNVLNKHQRIAVRTVSESQPGTTHLLHGVTGSGKTSVYIECADRTIRSGKSVIVLVPEIALTPQIVDEFSARFDNIYLSHSNQTEAERHDTWKKILNDKSPKIVIGPRSALLLPTQNIGLIVVDESHEPSYKQEKSPRYSALRVASVLAKKHSAKLILGSATPSVVDYYLAKQGAGIAIELPEPAQKFQPPKLHLVDMTNRQMFTRHRFFSNILLEKLEESISKKRQVLFFHNRRGSASMALCEKCGWQSICRRCFIPMSLHADEYKLRCHTCGQASNVPSNCPECSNSPIVYKGIGTKMIESELSKLYPKLRIARFDGDSSATDALANRYKELYDGTIDIIVGTQVVAKGLDLPKLGMVGVVQADTGLSLPDFSSTERTFQLVTQAIGRVGRNQQSSSVVVQSFHPNNTAIDYGLRADYESFYKAEINTRSKAHFPPFTYLLRLVCSYKTEKTVVKNSRSLATLLRAKLPSSVEILGPTPAFYERQRDTFRWQLVLKSSKRSDLLRALDYLPDTHWQFELDPTNLL